MIRFLILAGAAVGVALATSWIWLWTGAAFGRGEEALIYGTLAAGGGSLSGFYARGLMGRWR